MDKTPLSKLVSLSGKTAIVTGGAMGIGLGIVRRLHEAGANIVIADMDEAAAHQVADELSQKRADSMYVVPCNVGDEADVRKTVETAVSHFGRLDIVVNNAGIFPFADLEHLDEALFTKVIDTNLRSVFLFTKLAAAQFKQQGGGGKIINVASVDSLHPSSVGLAAYDASKHAVWGFTKNTALELAAAGIQVNAIAPGGILTPGVAKLRQGTSSADMEAQAQAVPMKRFGDPDDIGRVALFLATDLSSYLTGSLIVADGGMLLA